MSLIRTLCLTFSMYSRIPMPHLAYEEKNMKYTFLCFPLVGVVIGLLETGWYMLHIRCAFSSGFYAAVATAIPFFVTGGFHMDGFLDTTDALSSFGSQERKLEILKDSHVGAFAVIWSGVYLLLNYGLFHEFADAPLRKVTLVSFIYILSRITSAFAAVTFPSAVGKGAQQSSLAGVKKASAQSIVKAGLILYLLMLIPAACVLDVRNGILLIVMLCVTFGYYYGMSKKQFGGITGDLAGWYLQVCELVLLGALTAGGYIFT